MCSGHGIRATPSPCPGRPVLRLPGETGDAGRVAGAAHPPACRGGGSVSPPCRRSCQRRSLPYDPTHECGPRHGTRPSPAMSAARPPLYFRIHATTFGPTRAAEACSGLVETSASSLAGGEPAAPPLEDLPLRPVPAHLDVDVHVRLDERPVVDPLALEDLTHLIGVLEGEVGGEDAEVHRGVGIVDLLRPPDQAGAVHEHVALHLRPVRPHLPEVAEADDVALEPLPGADLQVEALWVERMDVEVGVRLLGVVLPPVLRVPGDAHADVALLLALAHRCLEDLPADREGGLEGEAGDPRFLCHALRGFRAG